MFFKVRRHRGARGTVIVPYKTVEGSAKEGKDFIGQNDELIFHNNQTKFLLKNLFLNPKIF